MITIDRLTVRSGGSTLLDGVTMHLTHGAVHGIAGYEGAGKTTLLRILKGLAAPAEGSVHASGHPLRLRDSACLEANPRFVKGLTVRDCLELARHFGPGTDPTPYGERLGIPEDADADALPSGQRRLLGLAMVLLEQKPLLLLDEPFAELSHADVTAVQRYLRREAELGRTVVVTSSSAAPLAYLCEDFYLLAEGRCTKRYEAAGFALLVRDMAGIRKSPEK